MLTELFLSDFFLLLVLLFYYLHHGHKYLKLGSSRYSFKPITPNSHSQSICIHLPHSSSSHCTHCLPSRKDCSSLEYTLIKFYSIYYLPTKIATVPLFVVFKTSGAIVNVLTCKLCRV